MVQGTVTDGSGNPISGAWVTLTQGGIEYEAATDSSGNYTIATQPGSPIPTGSYTITSGNVTQNVAVGGGTTTVHLTGANPTLATDPTSTDETLYTLSN